MKNRVITSVAILAAMLTVVIFSEFIVYPLALALLAIIATFEVLRVIGSHKISTLSIPAYLISAAFPLTAYFVDSNNSLEFLLILAAVVFVYLVWLMGVSVFSKGRITFSKVSETLVGVTYVAVSFTSLSLIRYINHNFGVFLVVLVFVISWTCDTAAFAVGSLIGKHKLIPEISPKKTVEGAIGGVVFSALLCALYGLGLDLVIEKIQVNYLYLVLFGIILSVVSQLGDLIASLIKREYGVKDYGRIFPGHGGVLDRFDSVLAVSTILLILSIVFPPFVAG
jgi:phosphatidate cytidylyltransferase